MTDEQVFRNFLSAYSIVDIGTIQYVYGNKATVATSIFLKGKQVIYEDVEIIYPGNDQGVFGAASANSTCLIFIPRSCMPNVRDKKVKHGEVTFSKNGIKAMPIGNGTSNSIYTRYDNNGNMTIFTPTYNLTFSEEGVTLQRKDANASLTLNENGDLYLAKRGSDGVYRVTLENGQVQSKWTSKEQDVIWTDTLSSDGSRSFVQTDGSNHVLFSFSIEADGTVAFNAAQGLTLETSGDLVLKGANVTIDSTANSSTVNINNGNAVIDK